MHWLVKALLYAFIFAAIIGFAYAAGAIAQRYMNKNMAGMSKKHKGLQVHPYMEMIPGRVGQPVGKESEVVIAPDFDLSKPEQEDPKRA